MAKAALKGELVSVNSRSKAKTHRMSTAFVSTHTLGSLALMSSSMSCGHARHETSAARMYSNEASQD